MARSMLSFGMLCARAERIALRRRAFASGSPPPVLAAMVISRESLLKSAPRFVSSAPLKRLTLDHLLCPDMRCSSAQTKVAGQTCVLENSEPESLEKKHDRGGKLTKSFNRLERFLSITEQTPSGVVKAA